ncbi:large conductance mechanosensitive channel protein MscL [Oscillatoria sp. CS-180]|uniref:large conductance mechanosensitive channel protein MscL n=1 Tax=Oscillatoria sp. CS-180 TaxID=3021720 RepID=UPI00232C4D27|nr:large conductance mechanosensitive channel protein MscL [Oscillatoria sp. CS-180]MDB9529530.1 large conductance mechanosensitive channel protein MscL [Oscillatoria sp. CS-180]
MANGRLKKRTRSFWDDFKDFINRGNLIDLALAVILGGAFGAIVASFVDDILMPALINPFLTQVGGNWRELTVGPGIAIGNFLGTVINFIIIALTLFFIVKAYEKMQRKSQLEEEAVAEPTIEEKLNVTLERLANVLEGRVR